MRSQSSIRSARSAVERLAALTSYTMSLDAPPFAVRIPIRKMQGRQMPRVHPGSICLRRSQAIADETRMAHHDEPAGIGNQLDIGLRQQAPPIGFGLSGIV